MASVFLTRDCTHFSEPSERARCARRLRLRRCALPGSVKSPAGGILLSLLEVCAADSQLSVAVRRCFAHACLDHPLGSSNSAPSEYTPALDAQLKSLFESPPSLCLLQGPLKLDRLLLDPVQPGTPTSMSTVSSSVTALNGPTSLMDVVFMGFTLHNELVRCQKEDREQYARLGYFALATLSESH